MRSSILVDTLLVRANSRQRGDAKPRVLNPTLDRRAAEAQQRLPVFCFSEALLNVFVRNVRDMEPSWCLAYPTHRAMRGTFSRPHRVAFLALCLSSLLTTPSLHAETASAPADLSAITIPSDHGYLGETHPPSNAKAPIIVHIQEAHSNYGTQQHLVAILEDLIHRYGVRLILVEGGDGDVSLKYFRDYGSPEQRKQVAEKYLKAGILSAEEYLDITSDYPLILWGVEDRRLYHGNWQALQDGEPLRGSLKPFLTQIRQATTQLKPLLLNASATRLDEAREAFDRGEMGLTAYAGVLWNLATQQQLETSAYDEVARFVAVSQQEQQLKLSDVQDEQQTLVQQVQQIADDMALTALTDKASAVKAGTVPQVEFYETLVELAKRQGLSLEAYPHLTDYLAYLRESKKIRPGPLSDQLEQLAIALRTALSASSPESRKLTTLLDELTLVERLVETELSPDEYQRFQRLQKTGLFCGWGRFLEEQAGLQGLAPATLSACSGLEALIPRLAKFYETASLRDQALVTHAVNKLQESGERLAVLITGGFHSPEIARLLKEQGVGIVTVTPKVDEASDPAVYQAVLKYKQGLISLDQVMALTHPSATRGISGR